MLLVTLVIRACLAPGAPAGVLSFLSPDWSLLSQPRLWLEAAQHTVFSLQLGLGAQSALARCNKYRHNLVRDCGVVLLTHTVWVLLATLLTLVLVTITAVTSLYGYVEVIASSFADIKPSLLRWKPLAVVVVIALLFLMALSLATRAGLHIYHLVLTYVSTWPCLLISLLTLASA